MEINLTRRLFLRLSATTALVGGPFATLSAAWAQEPIEEITWALPSINDTMFVPRAWSTYVGAIMSLVQEGPLAFGDDLSLTPGVAESCEQADATTYKYTIREGVTFGDGSPLTPDDVVATLQVPHEPGLRVRSSPPSSPPSTRSRRPARCEVTVKLKAPNVQFQYTPAHMAGFIFKKSQLEENPEDIGTPDVLPLGTGPYRLVEFSPADRVVLEARDDYWGPKPVAKRIIFTAIPDRQTRLLAMQNGDIDGTFDLAISDIEQWKALGNVDVITAPSLGMFMLTLDQSAPPFDDIHVRKAIAYAVDREGLVQALLKGNGEAATALNPPEMWAGVLPLDEVKAFYATLPSYAVRPREGQGRARAVGPCRTASRSPCRRSTADPYMVNIMQSVAENLKQIGINVTRAGDRQQPVARRLLPARESRHADHGLLSGLRRCRRTTPTSSSPAPTRQGRNERLELQERRRRRGAEDRQRAVRPGGARRGAEEGVPDRQRGRRGGAGLLAGLGDGDQQQIQAHRLQRLLVQRPLGDPRLRPEVVA